jgi:hypothetical protein
MDNHENEDFCAYDHINKRVVVMKGEVKYSIPVVLTGTWRASISTHDVQRIGDGCISLDECVAALKRYRSNNRKSLIVSVQD